MKRSEETKTLEQTTLGDRLMTLDDANDRREVFLTVLDHKEHNRAAKVLTRICQIPKPTAEETVEFEDATATITSLDAEMEECVGICEEIRSGKRDPMFGMKKGGFRLGHKYISEAPHDVPHAPYVWSLVWSIEIEQFGEGLAMTQGFAFLEGDVLILGPTRYESSVDVPFAPCQVSLEAIPEWDLTGHVLDLGAPGSNSVRNVRTGEIVDPKQFSEGIQQLCREDADGDQAEVLSEVEIAVEEALAGL